MNLEEVISYLQHNPNFFEDNPEVLETMLKLSAGDSAPFIERQLQVLKNRERQQRARIDLIIDSVRSNQKLEKDLIVFASSLLHDLHDAAEPKKSVLALIKKQFNIQQALFVLSHQNDLPPASKQPAPKPPAHDNINGEDINDEEVRQRIAHGGSVCDDRLSSVLLKKLFAADAVDIHSVAFLPIDQNETVCGALILGSADANRFRPDMGVDFLDNLAILISRYLSAHGVIKAVIHAN